MEGGRKFRSKPFGLRLDDFCVQRSDMADHTLEHQPNRTTRDSRTQDTAHLSHLQEAMYISHPTQQRRDIFIFGNTSSDNTR